jgi:hypothetical protein
MNLRNLDFEQSYAFVDFYMTSSPNAQDYAMDYMKSFFVIFAISQSSLSLATPIFIFCFSQENT